MGVHFYYPALQLRGSANTETLSLPTFKHHRLFWVATIAIPPLESPCVMAPPVSRLTGAGSSAPARQTRASSSTSASSSANRHAVNLSERSQLCSANSTPKHRNAKSADKARAGQSSSVSPSTDILPCTYLDSILSFSLSSEVTRRGLDMLLVASAC